MNPADMTNLKSLLRSISLDSLRVFSQTNDLSLESLPDLPKVYGHWMAMALVAGPQIRVTFKVHFMSESGAHLSHKAAGRAANQMTVEATSDFMKEYCNMTLGALKKILAENGLRSAISLPFLTRGFDEVFFPISSGVLMARDYWKIHFDKYFIACSGLFEVFESNVDLSGLPSEVKGQTDVGDVEFL